MVWLDVYESILEIDFLANSFLSNSGIPDFIEIDTNQTPSWAQVTDTQTPNWTPVVT
jgi:hypothetical protein